MSTEMEGKYVAVIAAQAEENAKLRAALTRVEQVCADETIGSGALEMVLVRDVREAAELKEL